MILSLILLSAASVPDARSTAKTPPARIVTQARVRVLRGERIGLSQAKMRVEGARSAKAAVERQLTPRENGRHSVDFY